MKTVLSLFFLIHLVTTAVPLPAQKRPPQPLYSVDLSKLVSQELDINPAGTLRFLTERTVAVSICRNLRCYLETLDLGAVKPQVIGGIRTDAFQVIGTLFRAPDGDVIAGNRVLDLKLREVSQIPKDAATRPSYISTTGETFVKQDRNDWVAYKMELPRQRILSGTGTILSVSDDALAYFDEGTVHIEGTDGTTLGSFATLPPKTLNPHFWIFLDNSQIYSYASLSWQGPSMVRRRFGCKNTGFQWKDCSNFRKTGWVGLSDRTVV
ncbi:MAG: hypothetical protein WAL52_14190 [Candidatus Sulfotelmatobacter sp.]